MTRLTSQLYSACAALLLSCGAAGAERPEIDVDYHQLGEAYGLLLSFTAAPEIAASRYNIDSDDKSSSDAVLKTTKLPLYREFTSEDHDWLWYVQATANYSTFRQKLYFDAAPPLAGTMKLDWTAYGGLFEAGVIFPVSHDFSVAAGLGAGVSHLENEADFNNQDLEDILAPILDGALYNWDTNASNLRGNLGLLYDAKHHNFGLKGSAHYTISRISTFSESSKLPEFSANSSTFTLKLDIKHPLSLEINERPTFIVGHLGSTYFLGDNKNELGFDSFYEAGLSFGIQKVTLGALAVYGKDVDGWNIVLNYDY